MHCRFDEFELSESSFELRRSGQLIRLERRVFDLLAYLVRHSSRVVTKAELLEQIWSGRVVAEGSLTVAVSAARKALGDDSERQAFIRTYQGRGYRFVKPVAALEPYASTPAYVSTPAVGSDLVGRAPEIGQFLRIIEN